MLHNCRYDKIKTIHSLSKLAWFLKQHALIESDQNICQDVPCKAMYESLLRDLQKYIDIFDKSIRE